VFIYGNIADAMIPQRPATEQFLQHLQRRGFAHWACIRLHVAITVSLENPGICRIAVGLRVHGSVEASADQAAILPHQTTRIVRDVYVSAQSVTARECIIDS
jgi:hypothetical protein